MKDTLKTLKEAWNLIEKNQYGRKVVYEQTLVELFSDEDAKLRPHNSAEVAELINSDKWETAPDVFLASVNKTTRPEMLSEYTVDDFAKMETYKVPGIDAGFALKPLGHGLKDIVSVHNNSNIGGIGTLLMQAAIKKGGNRLDHFDGWLSKFYEKLGFIEYKRDEYNPLYDRDGMLAKAFGEVPVIYRKLKGT